MLIIFFQVASANIKTPSMTIPFLDGISDKEKERLRVSLNRVTLSDVLETVHITETTVVRGRRQRNVQMRFEFLPRKAYKDKYDVEPSRVVQFFEKQFITKVRRRLVFFCSKLNPSLLIT